MRKWTAVVVLSTSLCALHAAGGENGSGRKGPLAKLPSAPGAHVARIKALGDGGWLSLGKPAPDPKYGAAPGRSYTCKMAGAPDLGGGFLYGEGVHGGSAVRGGERLYNDDLFFYDLNAHAWVAVYPGTPTSGKGVKYDAKLKCEVNEKGEPLPVAVLIHGYSDYAYSPKRKLLAALPNGSYYWKKPLGHFRDWNYVNVIHKQGPWVYDAAGHKWELRTEPGCPGPTCGAVLEFVVRGGREQLFRYTQSGHVSFYDLEARKWTAAKPKGPKPPWGIEPNACYDTKRNRVYMGGGQYPEPKHKNTLWAYDVAKNELVDLKAKNSKLSIYATWGAVMTYDPPADKVILMRYKAYKGEPVGLFVYDPEANSWSDPKALPEGFVRRSFEANGFYDRNLNCHVYHMAGDSRTDGYVWVYRHRKAAGGK
ncbi:MAG: hypothetical protein ACYTGB_01730 [Planctomycetota bacterium]|jgi:hypothetical protein